MQELRKDEHAKEKVLLTVECELVTPLAVIQGKLDVTATRLYFYSTPYTDTLNEVGATEIEKIIGKDKEILLDKIREVTALDRPRPWPVHRIAMDAFCAFHSETDSAPQRNKQWRTKSALSNSLVCGCTCNVS